MLVLFLFRPAVYLNPDDGDMADGRREAGNKIVKNRVRIQPTFVVAVSFCTPHVLYRSQYIRVWCDIGPRTRRTPVSSAASSTRRR